MDQKLIALWISPISPPRPRLPAPWALIAGGLLSAALYVPFTITHGPTSNNIEGTLWGMDMHTWGFLLGTIPNALIGIGLWLLRDHIAGDSRGARIAIRVIVLVLSADLLMNLAFGALGAPFAWLIIPPALVTAAVLSRQHTRPIFWALGVVTCAAAVVMLIPMETQDGFGGYRISGSLIFIAGGLLWTLLGLHSRRSSAF